MSGLFTSIRFVMALLTVLALAAKPFIPEQTLLIHPRADIKTDLFGPVLNEQSAVKWIDEESFAWRCDYPERYNGTSCGFSAFWNPDVTTPLHFIDASGYDGLRLHVNYEGRAEHLRVYLTNYNPEHQKAMPGLWEKFLTAFVSTEDLRGGPTFVSLKNFTVAEWWVAQQNPPRQFAGPEFGHLLRVGVDFIDAGVHRVRVDKIELVGERISDKTYLLLILLFWAGLLSVEAFLRYYHLKQAARHQRAQLQDLSGGTAQLAKENDALHTRVITDPLTGVWNRNGLMQYLEKKGGHANLPPGTALMVLDIDHFKTINDTCGHPVGDAILQEFAGLIRSEIRADDAFARWGGEEFVLLVVGSSTATLCGLAEKLRLRVEAHRFAAHPALKVTVSIGVARAEIEESLETLFKHADTALYQAKATRNIVSCAFPV
ncbi:MAG: GGDEF domain-containing protein [Cellvibrionaceae bacterium]|nr:GGDEF domain-containing protein [Cellvibrionaceae bacterium]